ncbi:MAG TPA: hypothetical protein VFN39_00410 [Gemmatimonadaceae bacterium]|nr:hypothetical protein [Gemmatimonadaceae bacterium]
MSTTAAPQSCPDPHQPDPPDDVRLRQLEKSLVVALVTTTAEAVRAGAADSHVREYVRYLDELHCPPEHVVIRVKRLLLRATRGMPDRSEAAALCEAMVLRAIQIYFERHQ